jgi:hypothetical protein
MGWREVRAGRPSGVPSIGSAGAAQAAPALFVVSRAWTAQAPRSPSVAVGDHAGRVQNEPLGHRGPKREFLCRARPLPTMAAERLPTQRHERLVGLPAAGSPNRFETVDDQILVPGTRPAIWLLLVSESGSPDDSVGPASSRRARWLGKWAVARGRDGCAVLPPVRGHTCPACGGRTSSAVVTGTAVRPVLLPELADATQRVVDPRISQERPEKVTSR